MNINESFPSKFLKASDLKGQTVAVTISHVGIEEVGEEQKPVLYFKDKPKGLVLNKTNGMVIADRFGPETDGWADAEIELYPTKTPFQGQMVACLRVQLPAPPPPPPADAADDSEPPF